MPDIFRQYRKCFFALLSLILLSLSSYAFEDCLIINDEKLTDISIENNKIVDIFPLITIMNEKNTLFVHPLQVGKTRVCVLKGKKDKVMFEINVSEDETQISEVDGFDILKIDAPPEFFEYELDFPPLNLPISSGEKVWTN